MKSIRSNPHRASARGFTLIELVVVVAIIGILLAIVGPKVFGSKNSANATLMIQTSQTTANNWMLVSQTCGTTTDATLSPIMDSGKTMADVIFGGIGNVAAAYKACYKQANVIALSDVAQQKNGGWAVAGYQIGYTGGGGSGFLKTTYDRVPDELVLMIASKYITGLSDLATDDTTSPVVQYGASSGGTRNVAMLRQVN